MLFYTSGAILSLFVGGANRISVEAGDSQLLALQLVFYGVALCFIAIRWRTMVRSAWNVRWIIAYVLVAMASSAWSVYPSFTLRRAIALAATTAFGIYFGTRYSVREQLEILAWTCFAIAVVSLFFVFVFPGYGIDHIEHVGDWKGVFDQKNVLARMMILGTLVFVALPGRGSRIQTVKAAGISVCLLLVFMSGSRTALLVGLILFAAMLPFRALRLPFTASIPILLTITGIGIVLVVSVLGNSSALLDLMGRSSNLTGRTELWTAVWAAARTHPWLGFGYSAFWTGLTGPSRSVLAQVQWVTPHSHNGLLDVCLDLGAVGVLLLGASYFTGMLNATRAYLKHTSFGCTWPLMFLVFLFLYNFTESAIPRANSILWILYVACVVAATRMVKSGLTPTVLPIESHVGNAR